MVNEFKVAIIGCGPSGMVIAHACHQMQLPFLIYAPKKKSHISGAQYLHSDINVRADGISPKPIHFKWCGTEWQYEKKIYGHLPEGLHTSWNNYGHGETVEAWPLIGIYDWLWDQYHEQIVDGPVNVEWMLTLVHSGKLVFNTAPLNQFVSSHQCLYETVWIINGISYADPDTIVYNGEPNCPWYRTSNLWGHMSIEFPGKHGFHPVPDCYEGFDAYEIKKPLVTMASIPGVIASGRYGRWEKGVLVDESYHQAIAEIKSRL